MPQSSVPPLKLAIIGCSGMIYDFIYDCTKNCAVELTAICGSTQDTRRFSQRYRCPQAYHDYREMLRNEKPDLVVAFSSEFPQVDVVRDCLLAGAHVYCERAVCHSSKEASEIVKLQQSTGRYVMARLNRRFVHTYVMAKEIVGRSEFGAPTMYLAKYHASPYDSEESFIWNHAIHHLDLARFLLGEYDITHVDRVFADPQRIGYNISFMSRSGCAGVIQTSSLQCGEYPAERVEITGNGRNVMVENIRTLHYDRPAPGRQSPGGMLLRDDGDTLILKQNFAQLNNFTFYGFENSLEYLTEKIMLGEKPEPNMEDLIRTIEQVETLEKLATEQKSKK